MNKKFIISYCHEQQEWVKTKLVPCSRAGGAEVLIDYELFTAGRSVIGQMDTIQDSADINLLVLSPAYLSSDYCCHELDRAIDRDPDFTNGTVIPIIRTTCPLPDRIKKANPLYINLFDDQVSGQWDNLMKSCQIELGADIPHWLKVRDDICLHLNRNESVNLVVHGNVKWRELINDVCKNYITNMKILDLHAGVMNTRRSFVEEMLKACDINTPIPAEADDLVILDQMLPANRTSRIAIINFDIVPYRLHFDIPLFAALRYLMESRRLVLLAQSKTPLLQLLPQKHPLSSIVNNNIDLKGRR